MDAAPNPDRAALLGPEVTITVCPDGPLLVRGPAELIDGDGAPMTRHRNTVALCRCGRSGIAPYCDGTHKKRRSAGGSAD
jgi:CDGSH-type Zn-finger protein